MECRSNKTLNSLRGSTSSSSSSSPTTTQPSSSSSSNSTPSLPFSPNKNSFSHQTPTLPPNNTNKPNIEHVLMKHINYSSPPLPLPLPPLCNDHTTLPNNVTPTTRSSTLFQHFTLTIASNASSSAPSSEPPLVTTLSLSSHHSNKELHLLQPQQNHHHHNNNASKVEPFNNNKNNPFQDMACSSDSLERKRFLEFDGNTFGDRRNKRMMKNRKSAARSRARKQAYTFELQIKVKQLLEENARLKRQYQQLSEIAATQQKRKHNLYRTSTAPF